jgi:hypothetical protein
MAPANIIVEIPQIKHFLEFTRCGGESKFVGMNMNMPLQFKEVS